MLLLEDIDEDDEVIGTYSINVANDQVVKQQEHAEWRRSSWQSHFSRVFSQTFLPVGYPYTVRPEYLSYQIWDAIQGLSSYLRSVLATKSLLAGVGVGSLTATPLSAAMTWMLRDGCGMIGGLLIAYCYAPSFEVYTKEWRLFADFLNNMGLTLDLLSCMDNARYYIPIIITSTLCKAGCGLIAGATKTRISAHFALKGQVADVAAKESTQETAVALIGLVLGMGLAYTVGDNAMLVWSAFLFLLLLHQYANYRLVRVLIFHNLNTQRALLLTHKLLQYDHNHPDKAPYDKQLYSFSQETYLSARISPKDIAEVESVLAPLLLSRTTPRIGVSLKELTASMDFPKETIEAWRGEAFLLTFSETGRMLVSLEDGATDHMIVRAYLIACYITLLREDKERFTQGMKDLAERAKCWCDSHLPALTLHGWTVEDGSALGVERFRYKARSKVE